MTNDINLLQRKTEKISGVMAKRLRIIRFISISCIFIIPLATLVLSLFIIFSPLTSIQSTKDAKLRDSKPAQKMAADIAFVNDRMSNAGSFILQRTSYDKVMNELLRLIPAGSDIQFTALQIDSTGVKLSISSSSLNSLKVYQSDLETSAKTSQIFKKVTLGDLSLGESIYNMDLILLL